MTQEHLSDDQRKHQQPANQHAAAHVVPPRVKRPRPDAVLRRTNAKIHRQRPLSESTSIKNTDCRYCRHLLCRRLILSMLSPSQGSLTQWLSDGLLFLFGWGGYAIPIALGIFGFIWFSGNGAAPIACGPWSASCSLFFTFEAMGN